jgi:hypothetical protein
LRVQRAVFDPERTYEQPESGSSTEYAEGAVTHWYGYIDERSEDQWSG